MRAPETTSPPARSWRTEARAAGASSATRWKTEAVSQRIVIRASRMEPIDFEWLEVRAVASREWTAGVWRFSAALTPADRGSLDRPHLLATATCVVTEAKAAGFPGAGVGRAYSVSPSK